MTTVTLGNGTPVLAAKGKALKVTAALGAKLASGLRAKGYPATLHFFKLTKAYYVKVGGFNGLVPAL